MAMSLGPLEIDLNLVGKDPEEIKDMVENLSAEAQKLTSGSDARILLHMIIGYMNGISRENS